MVKFWTTAHKGLHDNRKVWFLRKKVFVIVLFGHFSDLKNVCKRESGGVYHVAYANIYKPIGHISSHLLAHFWVWVRSLICCSNQTHKIITIEQNNGDLKQQYKIAFIISSSSSLCAFLLLIITNSAIILKAVE